jgi:transposase
MIGALDLNEADRERLEFVRNRDPLPYVRERAAAISKFIDGMSVREIAEEGLLRQRSPRTVRRWIKNFRANGEAGLLIREGRGRKAAFSPLL